MGDLRIPEWYWCSTCPKRVKVHHAVASGFNDSNLSDIPGVPPAFAACVAYRESTDLQNPAANGNAYGIIPASGYNVAGASLAVQKHTFLAIYDNQGPVAWAADGCPGT